MSIVALEKVLKRARRQKSKTGRAHILQAYIKAISKTQDLDRLAYAFDAASPHIGLVESFLELLKKQVSDETIEQFFFRRLLLRVQTKELLIALYEMRRLQPDAYTLLALRYNQLVDLFAALPQMPEEETSSKTH
ncbi:MAG: hypothetical protein AAB515_00080 [Patescibacteria group bacterium]